MMKIMLFFRTRDASKFENLLKVQVFIKEPWDVAEELLSAHKKRSKNLT